MPAKRRKNYKVARKNNPRVYGAGILGDVWKGIKKAAKFVKKHKGISRGAKIWQSLGLPAGKMIGKYGKIAGRHGFGKKRRGKKPGPKRGRRKGIGLKRAGAGTSRAGGALKRAGTGHKMRAGYGTRQAGGKLRAGYGTRRAGGARAKPKPRRTKRVFP